LANPDLNISKNGRRYFNEELCIGLMKMHRDRRLAQLVDTRNGRKMLKVKFALLNLRKKRPVHDSMMRQPWEDYAAESLHSSSVSRSRC